MFSPITTQPLVSLSLTQFMDFVGKTGSAKQTQVAQLKQQAAYSPQADFYRKLREGLTDLHRRGDGPEALVTLLANLNPRKEPRYTALVEAYRRWWGKQTLAWREPPRRVWVHRHLQVRVNPELALTVNGQPYVFKLYLRDEPLSRTAVNEIIALMEATLRPVLAPDVRLGLLDLYTGKARFGERRATNLLPLLRGEADSLLRMWEEL